MRDSGTGRDEATRLKAFERFFSTKAAGEGSGLGLVLVHRILRDHQGAVELESMQGVGTTVHCLLPVLERAEAAIPTRRPPIVPGQGERVLFVDDEPSLVSLGRRQIESLGYTVRASADPGSALSAFRTASTTFDILVTDYRIPGMNGLQRALQELRPGHPVLLLSGFVGDFTPDELHMGGVVRVLQKPWATKALPARCAGASLVDDPPAAIALHA
ncbi:MAG: response regulator [Gemmatimonadota bacterium]